MVSLPVHQLAARAHDLEGLAGVGVVELAEGGRLEATDLHAMVGAGAGVVVERDVPPGQRADALEQAGVVLLDDGEAVGAAFAQVGAVGVLGVQGDTSTYGTAPSTPAGTATQHPSVLTSRD